MIEILSAILTIWFVLGFAMAIIAACCGDRAAIAMFILSAFIPPLLVMVFAYPPACVKTIWEWWQDRAAKNAVPYVPTSSGSLLTENEMKALLTQPDEPMPEEPVRFPRTFYRLSNN